MAQKTRKEKRKARKAFLSRKDEDDEDEAGAGSKRGHDDDDEDGERKFKGLQVAASMEMTLIIYVFNLLDFHVQFVMKSVCVFAQPVYIYHDVLIFTPTPSFILLLFLHLNLFSQHRLGGDGQGGAADKEAQGRQDQQGGV